MNRWLDGTATPRGGVGFAHDAEPFNMHAELERVWTSARARARAADGCGSQCKKWALSHTNSYWYVRPSFLEAILAVIAVIAVLAPESSHRRSARESPHS